MANLTVFRAATGFYDAIAFRESGHRGLGRAAEHFQAGADKRNQRCETREDGERKIGHGISQACWKTRGIRANARPPQAAKNDTVASNLDTGEMTSLEQKTCGECSLCCKVMAIDELKKPQGVWCQHFQRKVGCSIYSDRPKSCQAFVCLWLATPQMGDEWKPDKCGMVLIRETSGSGGLTVQVASGTPGPWREPYLSWLRQVSARGLKVGANVLVIQAGRTTLILPDRGIDLGVVSGDDRIVVAEVPDSNGQKRWDARVMSKEEADALPLKPPIAK